YSQRFNGNQFTWGKLKVADKVAKGFRVGGWLLGTYNAYAILKDKDMSTTQKWLEGGSNAFGTLGGIYGGAWTIGWGKGGAIAHNEWYRENIRPHLQDLLGIERDEFPKLPYDIDALDLSVPKK